MKKVCSRCKEERDVLEFNRGQNKCRECSRELSKGHYQRNKEKYAENQWKRRHHKIQVIESYKASNGCEKCGEKHPACLDFHHINGDEKEISISSAIWGGWSIERIMEEAKKCMVICSNCHRKLHWEERKRAGNRAT